MQDERMYMKNQISVIIPIYNIAPYLDRCISSVCNQTYRNLQIILVDDGSTDGSAEICDRYALKDKRIFVIHKENGGLVSARKAGLSAATGEYAAYVDGDDWIEPDMYERMIEAMEDSSVDMVETDAFMDMLDESVPMLSRIPYGKYDADEIIPIMLCDSDFNECRLKAYVWSKLFRRELLVKVQYLVDDKIRFGEDVAVTYPYILLCHKIRIMDYAGYHYDQRQDSMIYTMDEMEEERNITLIQGLCDVFSKNEYADILLPQLNQYAKLLFLLRNISYFDCNSEKKILTPFGGMHEAERVVIYGAGRVGQSMYQYLKNLENIKVLGWLDREYKKYQKMGWNVQAPENICRQEYKDALIIIAVNSRKTATSIRNWLLENGIKEGIIFWLTEEFIQSDMLIHMFHSVAVCGYRKFGKEVVKKLKQKGIRIPFIMERNYESLRRMEKIDIPIVGFDCYDLYSQAQVLLITPDIDYKIIKECLELAEIQIPQIRME